MPPQGNGSRYQPSPESLWQGGHASAGLALLAMMALLCTFGEAPAKKPYHPVHPNPALEQWRWQRFPELNGKGLRCLAEASDGAMWFGADAGVRRYDGHSWEVFGQEHGVHGAPVNALCAARDGSVYAGTDRGISRYKEGAWERVFPPEGDLPWPLNSLVETRDGSIWAGTGWGAVRLHEGEATVHTSAEMGAALRKLAPYVRLTIAPDEVVPPRDRGEGAGFRTVEGENLGARREDLPPVVWTVVPGSPADAAGLHVGDRILHMAGLPCAARDPWVTPGPMLGSPSVPGSLTVQRGGESLVLEVPATSHTAEGTYRDFAVSDVYEDAAGALWFGLTQGEIVQHTPTHKPEDNSPTWQLHDESDGLDCGYGPRILQTRDGDIWTVSQHGFRGVNRYDGTSWTSFRLSSSRIGGSDTNTAILQTKDGTLWIGGSGLCTLAEDEWRSYGSAQVPTPTHRVRMAQTTDGAVWVAGLGQEAVRLDLANDRWTTFAGLNYQVQTSDGSLWFVSQDGGVVRFDGRTWTRFDKDDGLMGFPFKLVVAQDGSIWAAGSHSNVAATARFDGSRWARHLHPKLSWGIDPWGGTHASADGSLWFGGVRSEHPSHLGGVLRFRGGSWDHFTPPEAPEAPYAIAETTDGTIWFGGRTLSRYDGSTWQGVAGPEGPFAWVHTLCGTAEGALWVGTRTYGAFCFDGEEWQRHDVGDGLADNSIRRILQTRDGSIWAATETGISRFDGSRWVTHALPVNLAVELPTRGGIKQSEDGSLWINHFRRDRAGLTLATVRYVPDTRPPDTRIAVAIEEIAQPGNTVVSWTGADRWHSTRADELLYSFRLDGGPWSPFSPQRSQILSSLLAGKHVFDVKARDLDFNEDPTPATVRFTVVPPVWQQPWFLFLLVVFVGMTGFLASRIIVRTRERDELLEELKGELAAAHEMQMELMPTEHPGIEGFDIAGRCIPAADVGGDYFQYFLRNGKLLLSLADVTGRAMQAAIPVVMFSGLLKSQVELGGTVEELFSRLNRSLCGALRRHTLVCLLLGELDTASRTLRLSNGGCPYPYHFCASDGDVVELQATAYPLGIRPDTQYEVVETRLESGDCVVFCSDGIVETASAQGEQFGYERTAEAVREACAEGLSAESTIDRMFHAADLFREGAPQEDDMTCVVLRVL